MSTSKLARPDGQTNPCVTDFWLWFGVLGGAVAWLLHLLLAYGIAEFGCVSGWGERHWFGFSLVTWLEVILSLLMLVAAVWSLMVARCNQHRLTEDSLSSTVHTQEARLFLSRSGVVSNQLFILIIAVESIPILFYWQGC